MQVRKNKVIEKMRLGQKAYGAVMNFPSTATVELLGESGLDWVFFDCEHGPFTPETIDDHCRVADLVGLTPIVRTYGNESGTINRWLDRGVMGIMAPHVSTPEQARNAVNAVKFAPIGQRSWGGGRGTHWNKQTDEQKQVYMRESNANLLLLIQFETAEAIENVDSILKVDGVDLYTYGPNDLAQSMGFPGQPGHPKVVEAMRRTTDRVHAAGKKMESDVMVSMLIPNVIMDAAKALLKKK